MRKKRKLKLRVIQDNFSVGDITGNINKILLAYQNILKLGLDERPDIVVFSEMCITGYPAEDLYLQRKFQDEAIKSIDILKNITKNNDCAIIAGNIYISTQNKLYNSAYLITKGKVKKIFRKIKLPNYSVFDEKRYFKHKQSPGFISFKNYRIGILICEDMWDQKVTASLCNKRLDILISLNASPYTFKKDFLRKDLADSLVKKYKLDLIYVNQFGGQDELVFDGGSFVYDYNGRLLKQMSYFEYDQLDIHWIENQATVKSYRRETIIRLDKEESIYRALILGLKDYIYKNGFSRVILGISGGIDSYLSAYLATDALGKENVIAAILPSQYNSNLNIEDAKELTQVLGMETYFLPINNTLKNIRNDLFKLPGIREGSIVDQNIQARIRGLMLMAISNNSDALLLSTGNKTENAVGYATIYGDMCGGYNLLKDVYKSDVFELSRWRNIPKKIINKSPSAELYYNQKDEDVLPKYEILDLILYYLIDENLSIVEVSNKGFDHNIVKKVFNLLKNAEYKRRQSCIGPIISESSLSKHRRYPITNGFLNL